MTLLKDQMSFTPVIEEIRNVFREEIGIEAPDSGEDLIASGLLDSLSIVSLLVALEQHFDVRIALNALGLDSIRTLERIERMISHARSENQREPGSATVWLMKSGAGRPVFLPHTSHASYRTTEPIAAVLDTARPIYGLQARGFDSSLEPHLTVEEMAASYTDEIRSVQPAGPYSLAGYSFGGLIAYEIACQLVEAGERVDVLALIDTQLPAAALSPTRRLAFRLSRPFRYLRHILASPRSRLPIYTRKFAQRLRVGTHETSHAGPRLPTNLERFVRLASAAELAYRPRPFDGDAVLFLAKRRLPAHCNPEPAWRNLINGRLHVIPVGGEHSELYRSGMEAVGRPLSELLNR